MHETVFGEHDPWRMDASRARGVAQRLKQEGLAQIDGLRRKWPSAFMNVSRCGTPRPACAA
jgi:hypothetical protein